MRTFFGRSAMTLRTFSHNQAFADRREAGRMLAQELGDMELEDPVVLGIPRGGVAVAAAVSRALSWPMDICLVNKLGAPGNPELAIGSVLEGGYRYIDDAIARQAGAERQYIEKQTEKEKQELQRRAERYRAVKPREELQDRTLVLVDDGVATGATMKAAIHGLTSIDSRGLVAAVPCAPRRKIEEIAELCDETLCLNASTAFGAVSQFYRQFEQVTDDQVLDMLRDFSGAEDNSDSEGAVPDG